MPPKRIGSTWVSQYDGRKWPVVLCDDNTPPVAFTKSRPNGHVLPAILLGRHKYIWVADRLLKEYEPSKDYLGDESKLESGHIFETGSEQERKEKERRNAFVQDATLFKGQEFWKNYIESKSQARKLEREMLKRKRPRDDDDIELVGTGGRWLGSTTSSKKQPYRTRDRVRSSQPVTPGPIPVKSSLRSANDSRKTTPALRGVDVSDDESVADPSNFKSDLFVDSDDEEEVDESKVEEIRERNRQRIRHDPPKDDVCTIFIGVEHTPILVTKDAVGRCDFLADRVSFNEGLKTHIYLDEDTDISYKDFMPIWEYMQYRDFVPRLVDSNVHQRLQGVVKPEGMDKAAVEIAQVYHTASKIQFSDLQLLCVNKLKVLYPLSPDRLLLVIIITTKTDPWGCEAENYLREWLIGHVAESFWRLVATEGMIFGRIMAENEEFRQSVLSRLAQNSETDKLGLDGY